MVGALGRRMLEYARCYRNTWMVVPFVGPMLEGVTATARVAACLVFVWPPASPHPFRSKATSRASALDRHGSGVCCAGAAVVSCAGDRVSAEIPGKNVEHVQVASDEASDESVAR